MTPPTSWINDIAGRIAAASPARVSEHAKLYRISERIAAVILRQPLHGKMPSPYVSKNICSIWFPSTDTKSLLQSLAAEFTSVEKTFILHNSEHGLSPVRMSTKLNIAPVYNRRVTCSMLLNPSLSKHEWQMFGNTWLFRVLVNYDVLEIRNSADIALLMEGLAQRSSFCLSVQRYEGDHFSCLCDENGCSLEFVEYDTRLRLFSINPVVPRGGPAISRNVDQIDGDAETEPHFLIPRAKGIAILAHYLQTGSVTELQEVPEARGRVF